MSKISNEHNFIKISYEIANEIAYEIPYERLQGINHGSFGLIFECEAK